MSRKGAREEAREEAGEETVKGVVEGAEEGTVEEVGEEIVEEAEGGNQGERENPAALLPRAWCSLSAWLPTAPRSVSYLPKITTGLVGVKVGVGVGAAVGTGAGAEGNACKVQMAHYDAGDTDILLSATCSVRPERRRQIDNATCTPSWLSMQQV